MCTWPPRLPDDAGERCGFFLGDGAGVGKVKRIEHGSLLGFTATTSLPVCLQGSAHVACLKASLCGFNLCRGVRLLRL